ncbi:MAG: hypothetical protein EOP07_08895 [Proteobacteria bacterium]|nr:MAG: hypothetical protein EOP07_08895 [Pseudomonadota bacterium]
MNHLRIRHPVILLSLVLLIVNDHFLKGSAASGLVTGKLSDFAGLFFFPFFAADCFRISNQRVFDGISIGTGLAFVFLKCSPLFLDIFRGAYDALGLHAAVVQDPTDLWALIVLPLACAFEREVLKRQPAVWSST